MYLKNRSIFLDINSKKKTNKQKTVDLGNSFPLYKVSDAFFFYSSYSTYITDNQVKVQQ